MEAKAPHEPLSDTEAHRYVMSMEIGGVVQRLIEILGAPLVAKIGNVKETRAVAQWALGRAPQRESELRCALQISCMIAGVADASLARAWFQASNPHLDDRVPSAILRDGRMAEYRQRLMSAARAFAAPE